ncbi:hypothetical protein EPA93_39725 [Ktedonosporobacter rubrisoli]|uniref:Uncharacterized protein n=1 Tax=Ktedonosporobacter rubrisoli TaxID=2509675 RepID=A0A4P6K0R5_KTERU|nr:glycosyltransferase family 39 protein [Ktedonosporobacter rubrisoli]QBD81778.1 hypothetical protein EPA93_39725 [Ktedonosporobacter rubrisoli]
MFSAYFKKHRYGLIACALILTALLLRIILISYGWPETNSDEGTMGIEALHIAYRGEWPIYLYGQDYMGVAEAYIGAVLFQLLGTSLFSLRLGMLLLFALFLFGIYWLGSLLFGKRIALATLLLLVLGSRHTMLPEIMAVGGASETLVCAALLFCLSAWLVLSAARKPGPPRRWPRLLAFAGWGMLAGLALWSHLLSVPFVITSGLVLGFFCRGELRTLATPALLLGLTVGALPLIIYNLTVPLDHNSLAVFWSIHHTQFSGAPSGWLLLLKQLVGTIFYTLPMATGMSQVCPLTSLPIYGTWKADSLPCMLIQGGWGVGYLVLLGLATLSGLKPLVMLWRQRQAGQRLTEEEHYILRLHIVRLLLLCSIWVTLLSYASSPIAAEKPWSTRYLVGLALTLPAALSILFSEMHFPSLKYLSQKGYQKLWRWLASGLIGLTLLAGTMLDFSDLPLAFAHERQQTQLIHDLLRRGIRHIYSGYWDCDRLIFESQEHLICGVVEVDLRPGLNRYPAYQHAVQADPQAAYVFPEHSDFAQAFAQRQQQSHRRYQQLHIDGYITYLPLAGNG